MADDVKEFSREEAQGLMFHGAPQPSMAPPVSISNIPLPPPVKVSDSTKGSPVAKKIDSFSLVEKVGTANKKLQEQMVKPEAPSAIHELVDQISSNWKPLGIGALGVATAYGAARLLGGKKPIESLEGKPLTSKGPTQRIEPTFATPEETAVFKPVEQPIGPSQLDQDAAMIAKSEQAKLDKIRYAQEQEAIRQARFGVPQASDVQARNQAAEFRARQLNPVPPPPPPPPSISNAVATGGNVTQAVTQNIANDLDVLTKKEQGMKNWLLNQYGGKNEPMAHEAYSQVKNILGYTPAYPEGSKGGSLAPEEKGKILDWRKQELPGPKVNLTHDMKKALKAGGPIAAALIATTEFANAKTPEEKANAGANMLGAILPLGADIRDVGAPTLPSQQIPNAALLGSPYAQTEWAKTQRLREKAGAGRGIAPPSAYFR
jgi:hypothetical protein